MSRSWLTRLFLALGAIFLPLVLMGAYLYITRRADTDVGLDLIAIGISACAGATCNWFTLGPRNSRRILSVGYVLGAVPFLWAYSLYFLCAVFGDCL